MKVKELVDVMFGGDTIEIFVNNISHFSGFVDDFPIKNEISELRVTYVAPYISHINIYCNF